MNNKGPATGDTQRFVTEIIDTVEANKKFDEFLLSEIKEFVAQNNPTREKFGYYSELSSLGINPHKPLNTRNTTREQRDLLDKIKNKAGIQLLAEGKVKQLVEKAIVIGFKDRNKLEKIVKEFSRLYGFDIDTQNSLYSIIDLYFVNKPIVEDLFKTRNFDTEKIFKDLFGHDIRSFGVDSNNSPLIQIFQGPIGVELFCSNDVLVNFFKKAFNQNVNPLGFASTSNVNINGVDFSVLFNFNTTQDPDTYFHELRHNWNRLFKNLNKFGEITKESTALSSIFNAIRTNQQSPSLRWETRAEEYYRSSLAKYFSYFGDECLSKLRSFDTFDDFFIESPNNMYDYTYKFRNSQTNSLDLDKDLYYCSYTHGSQVFADDKPQNPYPGLINFELDRTALINIRQGLYKNEYLPYIREVTDKINFILTKKPDIRKSLMGTLGLYPDVLLWSGVLDTIIADL